MRTYSELVRLETFEERYRYLQIYGHVGSDTFGFDRAFNQMFYKSAEWQRVRREVIARDMACDLAVPDREILKAPLIHHMNPISIDDIRDATDILLDPEYLITTTHATHNAIHYGDERLLVPSAPIERRPNDTSPWRR